MKPEEIIINGKKYQLKPVDEKTTIELSREEYLTLMVFLKKFEENWKAAPDFKYFNVLLAKNDTWHPLLTILYNAENK